MISPHTNLFSKSELHRVRTVESRRFKIHLLDYTSSLGRLSATTDCPCSDLIRPTCEIADELLNHQYLEVPAQQRKQTSRPAYPAWVILPRALVAPIVFSSSVLSSSDMFTRRSSSATENGMIRSPGLCSSTHALILGNLRDVRCKEDGIGESSLPFILLTNIIFLAQVDEMNDGFGGK